MNLSWKNEFKPLSSPKREPGTLAQRHVIARGEDGILRPRGNALADSGRVTVPRGPAVSFQHEPAIAIFLDQPASVDLAQNAAVRKAVAPLKLQVVDPVAIRVFCLNTDKGAIEIAPDVVAGLQGAPEAERSGITAKDLSTHDQQRGALGAMGKSMVWVTDQVKTGKSILETWQAEAQRAIAVALWAELRAAPTPVERMAIVQDASEVFDFEAKQLQQALTIKQKQAAELGTLRAQVDASGQEVRFLQTMQDMREGKQVPDAVLAEMAQYYADRGDTAPSFAPPEARRASSRGAG